MTAGPRARTRRDTRDEFLDLGRAVNLPAPTHAQWQAVIDTLPLDMRSQEHAEQIEALFRDLLLAAGAFAVGRRLEKDLLGGSERREQFKKIREDSRTLLESLNKLPPVVWLALDEPSFPFMGIESEGLDLETLGALLERLDQVATGHLESGMAEPLPGRKLPQHRRAYMAEIIAAWESYTGQRAGYSWASGGGGSDDYRSDFLDFALAAAALIGPGSYFTRREFVEQVKALNAERRGAGKPTE